MLFQKICVMKKNDEGLQNYLKFEFSRYTLFIFDDAGIKKSNKSALYLVQPTDSMLLYRVKWPTNCSYQHILKEIPLMVTM